jgi:hypothetical protein
MPLAVYDVFRIAAATESPDGPICATGTHQSRAHATRRARNLRRRADANAPMQMQRLL